MVTRLVLLLVPTQVGVVPVEVQQRARVDQTPQEIAGITRLPDPPRTSEWEEDY